MATTMFPKTIIFFIILTIFQGKFLWIFFKCQMNFRNWYYRKLLKINKNWSDGTRETKKEKRLIWIIIGGAVMLFICMCVYVSFRLFVRSFVRTFIRLFVDHFNRIKYTICVDEVWIGASLMSRHFKIFSIMKNIQHPSNWRM